MPGVGDGGRLKRCFQRWSIDGVDWTRENEAYDRLAKVALDVLLVRAKHSLTQATVVDIFRVVSTCVHDIPQHEIPVEFRQILTFLEDRGLINATTHVVYDYCKTCGTLYRGLNKDSCSCQKCGVERNSSTTGTYVHRYAQHVIFGFDPVEVI